MEAGARYLADMSSQALITADDLLRLEIRGKCTELVRGRLIVREIPGAWHGAVVAVLSLLVANHVAARDLGMVFADGTGFRLASNPDTVRAADVAFVSSERVSRPLPAGYGNLAPDLAVEVPSPRDRPGEVLGKVSDWLDAGTRLVWVIDPVRRQARVYRADGSEALLGEDGVLDGEDVLPGMKVALGDVLRP